MPHEIKFPKYMTKQVAWLQILHVILTNRTLQVFSNRDIIRVKFLILVVTSEFLINHETHAITKHFSSAILSNYVQSVIVKYIW